MGMFKMARIKVKAKTGRGDGDDQDTVEKIIDQYDAMKEEWEKMDEPDKTNFINEFNSHKDGLGDMFKAGKDDFQCEVLDCDAGEFIDFMGKLGCSVE